LQIDKKFAKDPFENHLEICVGTQMSNQKKYLKHWKHNNSGKVEHN